MHTFVKLSRGFLSKNIAARIEPRNFSIAHAGVSIVVASFVIVLSQFPAFAQEPSLKGSGEVVIPTLGGSSEAALVEAYFEPFTRETGIKVVIVPEDHAKLMTSAESGEPYADITSLSGGMLASWDQKGLLEDVDYKYFAEESIAGIPPIWRQKRGVGRLVYSAVLSWNSEALPEGKRPQNWSEFFDTTNFPGPRGFANCDKIVDGADLEIALMADGVPLDKIYPIDVDRAFGKLEAVKPSIVKWWSSGSQQAQGLIAGEFDITSAYNGRIWNAMKSGAPVDFTWNQSVMQYDYFVVMKGAVNLENAMKFLAFHSRADRQAAYSEAIGYGPVNKNAFELISKDVADWLPGNPDVAGTVLTQDYSWWNALGPDNKMTNWQSVVERCTKMLSQ